jgi:RND superfamily putative drug exporter
MAPFAVLGVLYYNDLSYGLVADLPQDVPSVTGTRVLQEHFPAGTAGTVTALVRNDRVDFRTPAGLGVVQDLTEALAAKKQAADIADFRTAAAPLGIAAAAGAESANDSSARRLLTAGAARKRVLAHFVSHTAETDGHVTRLEVVMKSDPFSRASIRNLDRLEQMLRASLPQGLRSGSQIDLIGATASLRDLRAVGQSDRTRINILVTASVFVILVVLLRDFTVSLYLIASVLFSYLATLGVTFLVFQLGRGDDFPGLDWTVPLFLFTVLVAIGEDYNIFLVTRIHEEQAQHGLVRGITAALVKTGPIISSCGFIMAGTFCSLALGGHLARMTQLGFALAFGILLDTFVVRPVLVPAFLILLYEGWFGRLLGRSALSPASAPIEHQQPTGA